MRGKALSERAGEVQHTLVLSVGRWGKEKENHGKSAHLLRAGELVKASHTSIASVD